ncbi:MAG TPA: hypothetical protein VL380_00960 [Nitrosospira sp.]|jgi:hypothetical protein|nr:hypothetical protein [Nitrosospira sp.]
MSQIAAIFEAVAKVEATTLALLLMGLITMGLIWLMAIIIRQSEPRKDRRNRSGQSG